MQVLLGHIQTHSPQSSQDLLDDKPYPTALFLLWEVHSALTPMSLTCICCSSTNQSKLRGTCSAKDVGRLGFFRRRTRMASVTPYTVLRTGLGTQQMVHKNF